MNKLFLFTTLLFSALLAQSQSVATFMISPDYSNYFPKGAKSVKETTYTISHNEEDQIDTTITFRGVEYKLAALSVVEKTDMGNGKIAIKNYESDGALMSKGHKLFKDNQLIEDVDVMEDESLVGMGFNKYLTYDIGRVTRIVDVPCKDCDTVSNSEIIYDTELLPKEVLYANPNTGEMRIIRSTEGDHFVYDYKMTVGEDMKAMFEQMGETPDTTQLMPYDEVFVDEKKKTFTIINYQANMEHGFHFIKAKTEMTFDGNILLEEEYYDGELGTQIKYTYTKEGKLKSLTDMNGVEYASEYNTDGQYTKKREGYNWTYLEYDTNKNIIKEATTGFGDKLNSIIFYDIKY